jgi:hypothetical protein
MLINNIKIVGTISAVTVLMIYGRTRLVLCLAIEGRRKYN